MVRAILLHMVVINDLPSSILSLTTDSLCIHKERANFSLYIVKKLASLVSDRVAYKQSYVGVLYRAT